jgi:hypothetical protein
MTHEDLNDADDVLDNVDTDGDAQQGSQDDNAESSESRARRMGWKPKEEYKGKDDWVDADTFIEKTENDAPQLRQSLRTIERNYQKLEKSMDAILEHHAREIEEKTKGAYQRAIDDIESRLEKAIEDEDPEAIKKAIKARDVIKEREFKSTQQQPRHKSEPAVITDWKAKNPWFGADPVLTDAAAKYTDILASQGKSTEEQLDGAEKYIRETFPHKFRQPKDAPRMPGGSGNNMHKSSAPKPGSYEALTPEAKAECDRSVKGSGGKISKEDWLKYATAEMFRS